MLFMFLISAGIPPSPEINCPDILLLEVSVFTDKTVNAFMLSGFV